MPVVASAQKVPPSGRMSESLANSHQLGAKVAMLGSKYNLGPGRWLGPLGANALEVWGGGRHEAIATQLPF